LDEKRAKKGEESLSELLDTTITYNNNKHHNHKLFTRSKGSKQE